MGTEPREHGYLGLGTRGFHKLAYVEWGVPDSERTLLCVHGLTRNGRDFDMLAGALTDRYRVACPDIVGRGKSDWLTDKAGYSYPQYCADLNALIARLGAEQIDWVGTSMGGLIGMTMAAQPGTPIRRLVMNDIGPFIPSAGLARLARYVGQGPRFADLAAAVAYTREVAAPFGALSEAEWRHLAIHSVRQDSDGSWRLRYDPAIAEPFHVPEIKDVDLWALWERVQCPVLVLRGAESDLLNRETTAEMSRRRPRARIIEISGCGHAPALMAPDQIAVIRDFLMSGA